MLRRAVWLLAFVYPAVLSAQPSVVIAEQSVSAAGVTPGGAVVWFSYSREPEPYTERLVRRDALLTDDDGDGAVTFALDGPVAMKSLFVAVDLATGAFEAAVPGGYEPVESPLPGHGIGATLRFIEAERSFVEVLLVRAGVGAWGLSAGDGGAGDGDGTPDRGVQAVLADFTPIGASPAVPEHLAPGDLVLVLDPMRMDLMGTRVASQPGT